MAYKPSSEEIAQAMAKYGAPETATSKAVPAKKKAASTELYQNYFEKKEEKEVRKVVDEETVEAVANERSTSEDILRVIDKINKPFNAVTSMIQEAIDGDFDNDYLAAAKRGWQQRERLGTRDLLKTLNPEMVRQIEEKTKFNLFGYEPLEMDALSIPTFAGDIFLDPLTYIPVGAGLKIIKGGGKLATKGVSAVAKSVLPKAIVEGAEKGFGKALDRLTYYTDKIAHFRRIDKKLGELGLTEAYAPEPGLALERYSNQVSASGGKALRQTEASTFLKNLGRIANEKESQEIGKAVMESLDDVTKAFDADVSQELGVATSSLFKAVEVDDLLKRIRASTAPDEKRQLLDSLMKGIGPLKEAEIAKLTKQIDQGKGVKGVLRLVAKYETDATKFFQKAYFTERKKLFQKAIGEVDGKIKSLQKAIKSDSRTINKMMRQEVRGLFDDLNGFEKEVGDYLSGKLSEEAAPLLSEKLKLIKSRIGGLAKFEAAEAKTLTKEIRSSKSVVSRGTLLDLIKNPNVTESARKELREIVRIRDIFDKLPRASKVKAGAKEERLLKSVLGDGTVASRLYPLMEGGKLSNVVGDSRRFRTSLQARIDDMIKRFDQSQMTEIGTVSDEMLTEFRALSKTLKTELKGFAKANAKFSKAALKDTFDAGQQLSKELVDRFMVEIKDLNKSRAGLVQELAADTARSQFGARELQAYQKVRTAKIYTALNQLQAGALPQKLLREKKAYYDGLVRSGIEKRLPEGLRESAWAIYQNLQEAGGKLKAEGLLEAGNPFYFPRRYKFDMIDDVSRRLLNAGKGSGFLKKREFRYLADAKEWVEANGGKIETDAQAILLDYFDKVENKIARKQLTDAVLNRFKKEKLTDLPNSIQNSLEYLFNNGAAPIGNEVIAKAFKAYGNVLNKTKAILTVINPAFHGRNILGFPFLAATTAGMMKGFNPGNYTDAIAIMAGKKGDDFLRKIGMRPEFTVTTKEGRKLTYSFDEIRKAAEDSGYFSSSFLHGDIKESAQSLLNRFTPGSPRWFMSKAYHASSTLEDMGRYGALFANLRAGKELPEAIRSARQAMFDYNLINSPVDKALNGLFGFYTFTRRNFPMQFATLLNDPKQYAIISRVMDKVANYEDLSEEEMLALNDYDKDTFKIFGQLVNGVREFRSLGFTPTEEAFQTLAGMSKEGLEEKMKFLVGRINPVVKSFLDFYYQEDPSFGGEFGNTMPASYTPILSQLSDETLKGLGLFKSKRPKYKGGMVVGEEAVFTGPRRMVSLLRAVPFNRFLNDIRTLTSKEDVVGYLTGIKKRELDVEASQFFERRAKQKKLREMAAERGGKIYENLYVPKGLGEEKTETKVAKGKDRSKRGSSRSKGANPQSRAKFKEVLRQAYGR